MEQTENAGYATHLFRDRLHGNSSLVPFDSPLRDFKNVLFLVWKHLGLPPPTQAQYDMADFLQHGGDKIMLQAFRGVGKSWITVVFVAWCLLLNPQLKIEVLSASADLATNFTKFILQLIQDEELRIFLPLMPRREQRRSGLQFDVGPATPSKDPSVKSVGVMGQITGTRADLLIPDDIEVPRTSETQGARAKLEQRSEEFSAIIKPGGKIVFLGTPQHHESIYTKLPDRGYEVRTWPAELPAEKSLADYGGTLSPYIMEMIERGDPAGTPTDPKRFGVEDLAARKREYSPAGYTLQFMLSTRLTDRDRFPLRVENLMIHDFDGMEVPAQYIWGRSPELRIVDDRVPNLAMRGDLYHRPFKVSEEHVAPQISILAIDPAGMGGDEVAFAVMKLAHGYINTPVLKGIPKGYSDDNLELLASTALQHGVQRIVIEDNFGDGMFGELLKPHLKRAGVAAEVIGVKHHTQKEARIISALQPVMQQHRLIIGREVLIEDYESLDAYPERTRLFYSLIYQMTRLTRDKGCLPKDDRIDVLALGVNACQEFLNQDAEESMQQSRNREFDEQMEKFMRNASGNRVGIQGKPQGGVTRVSGGSWRNRAIGSNRQMDTKPPVSPLSRR